MHGNTKRPDFLKRKNKSEEGTEQPVIANGRKPLECKIPVRHGDSFGKKIGTGESFADK
jgi:hypothetical protein